MATKRQRRKRRRRQSGAQPVARRPSAVVLDDQQRAPAARRPARGDERPPALWGDFPLSEIVVFIGILLLIAGFFVSPPKGLVMVGVGLGLGSLAGLELAIREHFAGYRSHTLVLAAAVGVPIFGVLLIATDDPIALCGAVAAAAFAGSAWFLARAFRRRSGGALFRLRG